MEKVKLELTIDELNFMLRPFMRMPFAEVANFIMVIQQQVDPQLENYTPPNDTSIGPGEETKEE